ncbi:MAG: hypothetical protein ABI425_03355 [Patescibacteria group bacterium]
MLKSRPSMKKMLKSVLAFLFLISFFVRFFSPVSAEVVAPTCSAISVPITLTASDANINITFNPSLGLQDDGRYRFNYEDASVDHNVTEYFGREDDRSNWSVDFSFNTVIAAPQTLALQNLDGQQFCLVTFRYDQASNTVLVTKPGQGQTPESFNLCQQAGTNHGTCDACLANGEIWTGVGCIPFKTGVATVRAIIVLGLGITGTAVVLMTLYAGFMFSTSQGDPKRVDEAKSAVTSAIIGAFFIIFSVTILQFIGVSILHLPAFG